MTHQSLEAVANVLEKISAPYAVLPVGVPGSGKSTAMSALANTIDIKKVCPDDIRQKLTGNSADQTKNKEVWETTHREVGEFLGLGQSVIIDATHVAKEQRVEAVEMYKGFGATAVIAIVFDVDLATAKARNASRQRVVPTHVIDRMHKTLLRYPVTSGDGFDEILHVQ